MKEPAGVMIQIVVALPLTFVYIGSDIKSPE